MYPLGRAVKRGDDLAGISMLMKNIRGGNVRGSHSQPKTRDSTSEQVIAEEAAVRQPNYREPHATVAAAKSRWMRAVQQLSAVQDPVEREVLSKTVTSLKQELEYETVFAEAVLEYEKGMKEPSQPSCQTPKSASKSRTSSTPKSASKSSVEDQGSNSALKRKSSSKVASQASIQDPPHAAEHEEMTPSPQKLAKRKTLAGVVSWLVSMRSQNASAKAMPGRLSGTAASAFSSSASRGSDAKLSGQPHLSTQPTADYSDFDSSDSETAVIASADRVIDELRALQKVNTLRPSKSDLEIVAQIEEFLPPVGDENIPGMVADDPLSEEWTIPASGQTNEAAELFAAVRCNDSRRVRRLVLNANPGRLVPVDARNDRGETAAICAARAGQAAVCAALLDGRADPLMRDAYKFHCGDGVWPDERRPDKYGIHPTKSGAGSEVGRSVVFHMRVTGIFDEVIMAIFPAVRIELVRSIADSIQQWWGISAVCVAARSGKPQLAALLLNNAGAMPAASSDSILELSQLSRPSGAHAAAPSSRPGTSHSSRPGTSHSFASSAASSRWEPSQEERGVALLEAMSGKHWSTADVLLTAGVPQRQLNNAHDKHGMTALHIAAAAGETEVAKSLLTSGASMQLCNHYGRTPLHEACSSGHTGVVRLLLEGDADPAAVVREQGGRPKEIGKTPLELANLHGHSHLSSCFSDSEIQDFNSPQCTSEVATSKGKQQVVPVLSKGEPALDWIEPAAAKGNRPVLHGK